MSRPSSVIFSAPHGGIQTQLILNASTMPSRDWAICSSMMSVSGHPAEVSVMLMISASLSGSQLRS